MPIDVKQHEEYKLRAYKGDALAMTIARDLLVNNWRIKHHEMSKIGGLLTNKSLAIVAKENDIHPLGSDDSDKRYANAYEARLWEIFSEHGYDKAVKFFSETILKQKQKK